MAGGGDMASENAEHILICLSPSPSNVRVIQAAGRMARVYRAELTALYVETRSYEKLSPEIKRQLEENIELAKRKGARISIISGSDAAVQIAQYARVSGVTKIVIGRPSGKSAILMRKTDIVQRLISLAPEPDIFMIPYEAQAYVFRQKRDRMRFSWKSTMIVLALLMAATFVGLMFQHLGFTDANIITVYILSVLFSAFLTEGQAYGILCSIVSVLVFNFLFTEPRFTFRAYGTGYPVTFLVMFIAAVLTGSLTAKAKAQARVNAQKAYRTEVLLTASRNLQSAESYSDIVEETATQLNKLMGSPILITPVRDGKPQRPLLYPAPENGDSDVHEGEPEAIQWVVDHRCQVGAGTQTYPDASYLYLPICGRDGVFLVAGIRADRERRFGEFEQSLLTALLGECGVAIERYRLREEENALSLATEQEKLRSNLLRAISHDLRTPLTSISGNAEMLMGERIVLNDGQKRELYTSIYDDSVWLIRLVENLLSITRMDDNSLHLNVKPELVSDMIDEAVSRMRKRKGNHHMIVRVEDELILARMDSSLIEQVMINLLDNAIKYTREDSTIEIIARQEAGKVFVSVADDGDGIPSESKARIFEMFYTGGNARGDGRRGLGLGLALCKSIVEAHGSILTVSDNTPHGTVFAFTLDAENANLDP
jgi:two-component system sensor histidine kinase KdpD